MAGHRDEGYIGQELWLETMGARISTASVKRAQPIVPLHSTSEGSSQTVTYLLHELVKKGGWC